MREVEVSRFVPEGPVVVDAALSPVTLLEAEGSFAIQEIAEDGDRITVGGYGLELVFEFTDLENGVEYDQVTGPLETLRTTVSYRRKNEGSELTARSELAVGGPGVVDRLAAWKRKGELKRALDGIAEEC